MKLVEVRTKLTCTPAALWSVLLDFEAYPACNSLYSLAPLGAARTHGRQLAAGDRLRLSLGDPATPGKRIVLKVKLLEHVPGRSLVWKGGWPGLFVGVHHFRLLEEGGAWFLLHGESFTGLLTLVAGRKIEALREAYAKVSDQMIARASRG